MKAVIGLIPLWDDEKESYWMLPGYMKVLEKCGALPIMLPLTDNKEELDQLFDRVDGILLTGGHDVGPDEYGTLASEKCGKACKLRDRMEGYLLDKAIKEDKPVFGICRGIQFMNAHLGGTLYQDLPSEHPSEVVHQMTKPYDRPVHTVRVFEGNILSEIIGAGEYAVNSYHHQAVKDLAPELEVLAKSSDQLVEAVAYKNSKFIVGVQWHPEFAYEKDEKCLKLIQAFVNACK